MLEEELDINSSLFKELGLNKFKERLPWIGGDLQTLRDTFIEETLPAERSEEVQIPIPSYLSESLGAGYLLAFLDRPHRSYSCYKGLVLLLHGLGGSSRRLGIRRMAISLLDEGFAVMRLNLRGADPGRHLAGGTYAAKCNNDIIPALKIARYFSENLKSESKNKTLPLFGVGLSLGGTILLNACLSEEVNNKMNRCLDGLVCVSSPLDLEACSNSIERPRNTLYQRWLLHRLVKQTFADPFPISIAETRKLGKVLKGYEKIKNLREFDSLITAPRWGFLDVDEYYRKASPVNSFEDRSSFLPPTLFLQSEDDPWVPAQAARNLLMNKSFLRSPDLNMILTARGGHNGFHGVDGCWGDTVVTKWLNNLS